MGPGDLLGYLQTRDFKLYFGIIEYELRIKYQHFSGEVVLDGWVFWVFPFNIGAVLTMLSTVDC